MFQACDEGAGPALTSPHYITCANDTECLADESLDDEKDTELIHNLYNDTALFFDAYSTDFFIFHEPSRDYANAFASRKDGHNYIYFGNEMYYLLKEGNPDNHYINVLGVMAHEFAHIVQFNLDIDESKIEVNRNKRQTVNVGDTVVLSELEADAFSGYFMYHKLRSRDAVIEFITMMASLGDRQFESEQHHGTPLQRKSAAELGILAAKKLEENNITLSWSELRYQFLGRIESTILHDKDFE